MEDGRTLWTLPIEPLHREVTLLQFSADEQQVFIGTADAKLRVVSVRDGRLVNTFDIRTIHEPSALWAALKWNLVIGCERTGTIDMYQASDGEWRQGFAGHVDRIEDVAFTFPVMLLRTISRDGDLRSWNVRDGRCLSITPTILPADAQAKFSQDARRVLIAAASGTLTLYRLTDPAPFNEPSVSRDGAVDHYTYRRSPMSLEHIEAEYFDDGAPGEAYHDTHPSNRVEKTARLTPVGVHRDPQASAGEFVGDTHGGEWLGYWIIPQKGAREARLVARLRGTPGASFHLEIDKRRVTSAVAVPADMKPDQWTETIFPEKIQLPEGVHHLRVVFDAAGGQRRLDVDWFGLINP